MGHNGKENRWLGRRTPYAFTLIELCAGLTCIAMLCAIAQPSLEVARERAKQSVCLERLRTIGTASGAYAQQDPSGWAIPVHPGQYTQDTNNPTYIGAYEWGGKSGIGRSDFADAPGLPILGSKYGTYAGFGPATRPLNDILYPHGFRDNREPAFDEAGATLDTLLDLPAYRCPADDGPPRGGHCQDWIDHSARSSFDHFGNSYAANIFMIAASSGGYMTSNSPYMRPTTRVPAPARTIYYEENIGRWAWAARNDWCSFLSGINVGPTKAIRGWHGKNWMYNRAFGDAHAEMQKVYIEGTEDAEGYANHYQSEQVFANPSLQSYYHCVIIRGVGWQKDTLPAEPVATGLWHTGAGRPSYENCVSE